MQITTKDFDEAKKYWLKKFSGELKSLDLHADFPTTNHYKAESYEINLSGQVIKELIRIAKNNDKALYIVLLTVFKILLCQLSGQNDITVLSPNLKESKQYYNRLIALRDILDLSLSFKDFLIKVRQTFVEAQQYQYYPIKKLVKLLDMGEHSPLFRVIFLLENIQSPEHLNDNPENDETDMIFSWVRRDTELTGRVIYNSKLFGRETIKRLLHWFQRILKGIIHNTDIKISHLDIASSEEKEEILSRFNNTKTQLPVLNTIHQLFEQQAGNAPDGIVVMALQKQGNYLTFRTLNEQSRQLAHHLLEKGMKPGSIVGIILERSLEMLVGLLGTLKAGSAYLPIDPRFPKARISHMLKDAQADYMMTVPDFYHHLEALPNGTGIHIVDIPPFDNPIETYAEKGNKPANNTYPDRTAYILYTSGSTGKPKGVMVTHDNVIRLVCNSNFIPPLPNQRLLMTGKITFDISTFEIWYSLLNRLALHLVEDEVIWNFEKLSGIISSFEISILHLIPQLFNRLAVEQPGVFSNLKYLLVGGDLVRPKYINRIREKYKDLEILHMYGPTENTTFSTYFVVDKKYDMALPIGSPISNSTVYILDKNHRLKPIGAVGEICVGGSGIARGYLNQPELTAEKFKPAVISHCSLVIGDPRKFPSSNDRIYYTGDLGKWLPNGNIAFYGRIDHQVKIRGIRMELAEIENRLLKHDQIKEVVLIAQENTGENSGTTEENKGEKYLYAYIAGHRELTAHHLRTYLAVELPDYMIPTYFVISDKLPLNPHGKINRHALAGIVNNNSHTNVECAASANVIEKKLVEVWEQVLARKSIDKNSDFFMMGGDSIKAIQIAARMLKFGYKINIRDIFDHPTITQLAKLAKKKDKVEKQKEITGILPLTPVQKEFFQKFGKSAYHNNQAVMLYSEEGFHQETIKVIFKKIQDYHDALRMTFTYKKETGEMIQTNHGLTYPLSLEVYDFKDNEDAVKDLERQANKIQESIHLEKGPLMKLGLFKLDDGNRLLIVIHHLVIDGVSWRILLEDINDLFQQYKRGEKFQLPPKTTSFKGWAEKLSTYANTVSFLKEKNYWQQLETTHIPPLKKNLENNENYLKDASVLSFRLNEKQTYHLLTKVNYPFGTEINDILLTGLGLAVKKTFGHEKLLLALEGHGRDEIFRDVDISRTLGWFTCVYPVILDISCDNDLSRQVKMIKEHLHGVPNKGTGYGILKYLTQKEFKKEMEFQLKPQVRFNYLGQLDSDIQQLSFKIARESVGETQSLEGKSEFELDISGVITHHKLMISITYSKKQYKGETIDTLLKNYKRELKRIISHCTAKKNKELTPCDLTYKGLSLETLDRLQDQYSLEDIYILTPMQEGMLFHSLYENSSTAYFSQSSYRLHGELDPTVIEGSLNRLLERHDILRTIFIYKGLERPLQVVLKDRQRNFYHEDLSGIASREEKNAYIKDFKEKDRERLFDLTDDVLMRLAVLQVDETEYEVIWSHHHILMDGWCLGIIIAEFFEIYNSYMENREDRLTPVKSFKTYIQWLEKQETEKAKNYWIQYLQQYDRTTSLPANNIKSKKQKQVKHNNYIFQLEKDEGERLKEMAGRNHVTLNTLIRAIWGIILGKYNGREDVVFGAVVSGRPSQLEGVESMVGLFINTIPVRIQFQGDLKFDQLLQKIHQDAMDSAPYHYYPLADIQSQSILKENLYTHILAFENFPSTQRINGLLHKKGNGSNRLKLELSGYETFGESNYDLNVVIMPLERLTVKFEYNTDLYESVLFKRVETLFKRIVKQILEDEKITIKQLTLLSEEEKRELAQSIRSRKGQTVMEKIKSDNQSNSFLESDFNF